MSDEEFVKGLSDDDIDALIGKLCSARENNPDVMIMDNIINNPNAQEKIYFEKDADIIEEDIMNSIINSDIPLSQEEVNALKAKGIYDKYINKLNDNQEDDVMKSIEEEIMRGLETSEPENNATEVVSDSEKEVVSEDTSSFQTYDTAATDDVVIENITIGEGEDTVELSKEEMSSMLSFPSFVSNTVLEGNTYTTSETLSDVTQELIDTVNYVTSADGLKESLDKETEDTQEEAVEEEHEMTLEEFNDVPATSLTVDENILTSTLMDKYDSVTYEEAAQLIEVMNRYKSGEKFNVFEALPNSIKTVISTEAASCGADKATINFFAKSFINDLVNNTYLDKEIKDFNEELKETLAPMNNIAGTMMDEYSDEVYHKFTDKLEEKADEIQEEDPDKATQLREVSSSFKEAINLTRVINSIEATPSNINKAYKTARDSFKKFEDEYDKKVATVEPSPRKLKFYSIGLNKFNEYRLYSEAYINTLIVLVANTVLSAIEADTLTEHIYAYYASNAVYTVAFTNNNSEVNDIVSDKIVYILDKISEYMIPLEARNSKKLRKRNKKAR
jgi:hypothetical protein